jgi:ribonuclease HII
MVDPGVGEVAGKTSVLPGVEGPLVVEEGRDRDGQTTERHAPARVLGVLSPRRDGGRGRATDGSRVLGLDEAGRGSVLGPLVVAGFCCPDATVLELRDAGVRDSKLLSAGRRESVYRRLEALGERRSIALVPRAIDRYVARGALNELELRAFARLVRACRPDLVYVDACDPDAERFGRRLAQLADTGARVESRHRADRELPVVGAASIVAKVRRDHAIARLAGRVDEPVGSGYPSDPATRACVERHARAGGSIPRWMRRSWETVQRVKREQPARTLDRYGP